MSTAIKLSPRPRRHKQRAETMKQDIVAQVHKQTKSTTSSDNDYANSEDNLDVPKSDKNENYSVVHTPSREISVDGETQINSKILSLIETEMKRDINKHSHFTESRPQSLSFYEDEKIPEELSGNLELLSPEEKRHYRKRKEYSQMDVDERNAHNAIQDLYSSRDPEEILNSSSKKSKSRKKKYGDSEVGIGDSREMMIPKDKRKSKKKRREVSPGAAGNSTKRKHKTRNRDEDHQPNNDVTIALEELQDDVFENAPEDFGTKPEKMKRSPRRTDKIYVQKKSKFEETSRHNNVPLSRQSAQDLDSLSNLDKRLDVGHLQSHDLAEFFKQKKCSFLVIVYVTCLTIHLATAPYDEKLSLLAYRNHTAIGNSEGNHTVLFTENSTFLETTITYSELKTWNHLSLWRALLAFVAWIVLGFQPPEDMLQNHLKSMEAYLPDK
ncbi:uncharacterized protein LOC109535657 isoform X2 [Dendroctonus ponderosae]|uniref:uncharacterized protein LOC109535657 isoform X2 n=1 Tax=Dendroctonus ponderosae TaxID=77166 RepID=UPI0020356F9F|nr:uncharacterized protein LOC109535657 isoform X2 [Dendroctonus ponderosae]